MATKVSSLAVQIEAIGVDKVKAALREVDRAAASTGQNAGSHAAGGLDKVGRSARTAASGLDQMARSGNLAGEGLKSIVTQGAEMAFTFGPEGAIAGALVITGIALVSFFNRARKEMEETNRQAVDMLRGLSLQSGNDKLVSIYQGDASAAIVDPNSPEALGLVRAKARRDALQAAAKTGAVVSGYDAFDGPRYFAEQQKLSKWLEENERLHARLTIRVNQLATAQVGLNQAEIKLDADRKARESAKTVGDARMKIAGENVTASMKSISEGLDTALTKAVSDGLAAATTGKGAVGAGDFKAPGSYSTGEGGTGAASQLLRQYGEHLEKEAEVIADSLRHSIAQTMGDAVFNAFSTAFSGGSIGEIFKSFGKTVLSGLGQIFVQMGEKMVMASAIMEAFSAALASFIPGGGLVAGLALIALGSGMMALGGGRGAAGSRSGPAGYNGGGGYGNASDVIRIKFVDPGSLSDMQTRSMNTFNIIGPNDPTAQRQIKLLLANADRR